MVEAIVFEFLMLIPLPLPKTTFNLVHCIYWCLNKLYQIAILVCEVLEMRGDGNKTVGVVAVTVFESIIFVEVLRFHECEKS